MWTTEICGRDFVGCRGSVFDVDGVERGQEDGAEIGDEASGVDGWVLRGEGLGGFEVLGAEDEDAGEVVGGVVGVAECGAGEDDGSGLGVMADEGEVTRHEVFLALKVVPLRAFAEQAKEIGLEVAGDVIEARSRGVFGHFFDYPSDGWFVIAIERVVAPG